MSRIAALVACATAPDLSRKRQPDQADRKAPKNRARYLLNLVAEAAERIDGRWTDADLLEAALVVARGQASARFASTTHAGRGVACTCDACGDDVPHIIGTPDGLEVCSSCFNAGGY